MKTLIVLFFIFGLTATIAFAATDKIICYYGSWATYRNGLGKVNVEDIDPNLCSHIIYTFLGLTNDGQVRILDDYNEITNGALSRFVQLKNKNPRVKLMIAIGGWNEGSSKYSSVMNSPSLRTKFVNSVVSFVLKYKFDGFDIDWEYPAERGGISSDRDAFVQLLKELRKKFDEHKLLLSAAVAAPPRYHQTSYDVRSLSENLDFINVMTYDLHGSWDPTTGHNSALYGTSRDPQLNVDYLIQQWILAGANPSKIIIGVALYGRSFTLASPNNHGIGASAVGPGTPGQYSQEGGMLMYSEICERIKQGWTVEWDDVQKNPYAYKGNQWVGYDNAKSVALKAKYAVDKELGGVMIWSVESDDLRDICGEGKYALLKSLGSVIDITGTSGSGGSGGSGTGGSGGSGTGGSGGSGSGGSGGSGTGGSGGSGTGESGGSGTGNQGGSPPPPVETTAKPPITQGPVAPTPTHVPAIPSSICKKPGYQVDPNNCSIFSFCIPSNGDFVEIGFKCKGRLQFDQRLNICNIVCR